MAAENYSPAKKSPTKKTRPSSGSKKNVIYKKESEVTVLNINKNGSVGTAKFNSDFDEAPRPRNLNIEYSNKIPVKTSPKKRPRSPLKRPYSPSKLNSPSKIATHLDPNPNWARCYVRGMYYDDAINIVPNSKSPKKSQVKHGQMNFFMGEGSKITKPSSLKMKKHANVDE